MTCNPIVDRTCRRAPDAVRVRHGRVSRSITNRIVVPIDPKPVPVPRWISGGRNHDDLYDSGRASDGNEVEYLHGGFETFTEIHNTIAAATGPESFVYMCGWWFSLDLPLLDTGASPTMRTVLPAASNRDVEIRAMFWAGALAWVPSSRIPQNAINAGAVAFIEGLPTGAAVRDDRTMIDPNATAAIRAGLAGAGMMATIVAGPLAGAILTTGGAILPDIHIGSHHQKIIAVFDGHKLTAFTGGVDVNEDRIQWVPRQLGSPMHDVHCKITGPAAHDLLRIFIDRWTDHPEGLTAPPAPGKTRTLRGSTLARPSSTGTKTVQVGATFANGNRHPIAFPGPMPRMTAPYAFAPNGAQSAKKMWIAAVQRARKFIYLEDQELYGEEAAQALAAAIPRIEHLTILMPHSSLSETPEWNYRRQVFIQTLLAAPDSERKVRVFCPLDPAAVGGKPYVHSKFTIIDDEFALIGSMNIGRRSFSCDSEAHVGVYDREMTDGLCFAHRLRIADWAEHLGMNTPAGHAELMDGVASAVHWVDGRQGSKVTPYDEYADMTYTQDNRGDALWSCVNPDGS